MKRSKASFRVPILPQIDDSQLEDYAFFDDREMLRMPLLSMSEEGTYTPLSIPVPLFSVDNVIPAAISGEEILESWDSKV